MNTALKATLVGVLGLGLGFGSGWAWDAAMGSEDGGASAPESTPIGSEHATDGNAVNTVSTDG